MTKRRPILDYLHGLKEKHAEAVANRKKKMEELAEAEARRMNEGKRLLEKLRNEQPAAADALEKFVVKRFSIFRNSSNYRCDIKGILADLAERKTEEMPEPSRFQRIFGVDYGQSDMKDFRQSHPAAAEVLDRFLREEGTSIETLFVHIDRHVTSIAAWEAMVYHHGGW